MRAWPLVRDYLGARRRFHLSREALQQHQDRLARETVAYAIRHAPFYREHFAGHDPREWQTLPTIDKRAMMASFDTFNTEGIAHDEAMRVALRAEVDRDFSPTVRRFTVGLSSGTSGHRGLFLVDANEQSTWAATILARGVPRLFRRGGIRLALFLRSNSNLYQRLGRWIDFRYFDLLTPLEEAIAALEAHPPDLLVGPPSLLTMLAAARVKIRPELLVSVAEVLDPEDEARLRAFFGAPVHQVYQCTEGLLAVSCAHGSLHVQEDLVAMQLEDACDGRVTPIVTDLRRRTQPIIRYRLNDLLTLDPRPCACGSVFRVIARIEGRHDDLCFFLDRNGRTRAFFPDTLRRMVLLGHRGIDDYRIVQREPGQLTVHLEINDAADFADVERGLRETIARGIEEQSCAAPGVEIIRGIPPLSARAKLRRVHRTFSIS